MSFATMATLALGGAALGALANPDDRKKGALMGLGAGLLAPLAAPALAGGGLAAGAAGAGTAGAAGAAGTAGAAGAAGAGVTAAAAPVMTTGISGAGVAGMGAAPTALAAPTAASSMAAPVGIQSILPGAAINTSTGVAHTGTMASKFGASKLGVGLTKAGNLLTSEGAKDLAIGLAPQALASANKPGPEAPAPRSLAMQTQQGGGNSLYQRAAMNQQARMQKRQQGPKRFI